MKYALGNIVTEVLEKECQKKELYRTFQIPTFSIIKSWIVLIIHNVSFSFLYIKKKWWAQQTSEIDTLYGISLNFS